jgi:hypothetical protein
MQGEVKQGDGISPALFIAALEHAMQKWSQRLSIEGIDLTC